MTDTPFADDVRKSIATEMEKPSGKILNEIRDTKMAVDDVFHVLGELHAKLFPVLKADDRNSMAVDPEAPEPESKDSEVFDKLHLINQKIYDIQSIVRNMAERVDL